RFKLTTANVFEIDSIGTLCRGFVVIDRNLEFGPDLIADAFGELDAIFESDAFDGNERHHVGSADTGMRALLYGEVDQRDGGLDGTERRFRDRRRRPYKGQ